MAPGAEGYELVVYRVTGDSEDTTPVLRQSFSGSVFGWTPSLDRCLDRGGRYAWTVRAVGVKETSEWSTPSLFEVASGPSEAEFEAAMAVVQEYLQGRGRPTDPPLPVERTESLVSAVPTTISMSLAAATDEAAAPTSDQTAPATAAPAAPAAVSLMTEGAVAVGTSEPKAHLHVVGGPELGDILVAPSELDADKSSELFLAEDDDGTYGMRIRYDGRAGFNVLQVLGWRNGVSKGPWLTIARDTGEIKADKWNPDPPCFNTTDRFVDCRNGTVTDTMTGLIYLEDANCFGVKNWVDANDRAATLQDGDCDLNDRSRKGDWRLQTRKEWLEIVDATCSGTPKLVGNDGGGCYSEGGWALGVQSAGYWTSSSYEFGPSYADAHYILLDDGADHNILPKTSTAYVWPVRGGEGRFSN
jgi:hypothetical protein